MNAPITFFAAFVFENAALSAGDPAKRNREWKSDYGLSMGGLSGG